MPSWRRKQMCSLDNKKGLIQNLDKMLNRPKHILKGTWLCSGSKISKNKTKISIMPWKILRIQSANITKMRPDSSKNSKRMVCNRSHNFSITWQILRECREKHSKLQTVTFQPSCPLCYERIRILITFRRKTRNFRPNLPSTNSKIKLKIDSVFIIDQHNRGLR